LDKELSKWGGIQWVHPEAQPLIELLYLISVFH